MKWFYKLFGRMLPVYDTDKPKVVIDITYRIGMYQATANYPSGVRYFSKCTHSYEACFYNLLDQINFDRGSSLMNHDFQINFYNQSYIKEIGQ